MAPRPIVLLPPSEGKADGGQRRKLALRSMSNRSLTAQRETTIDALAAAVDGSDAARGKLLGVKGAALAAATDANRTIRTSPTMPAIERYTGVLYDALDVESLGPTDRERLDQQVRILSGLWGVVSPIDRIPDYKLKMGASLPGIGRLATAWREPITDALTESTSGATVWNLLPNEHAAAWAPPEVGTMDAPAAILTVKFLDEGPTVDGRRTFTTVNHWNKLLKGALVRFVLATGADEPGALSTFRHPEGYRYDRRLTIETDGVTTISMVRPAR